MALNAAAYHSAEKVAVGEKTSGLRAQTSFSAGWPGVLKDPAPQGAVTVGCVAAPGPLLAVPLLAGAPGEAVDDARNLHFLLVRSLAEKKEKEEGLEEKKWKEQAAETRRRAKKRRLPRFSSRSLRGGAHRRQRQWHALYSGSLGDVPLRAVFPSVVFWPEMPGIMASMNHKDSSALIVDSGSDMCKARLAGLLPRFVCSLWWSAGPRAGRYGPEEHFCLTGDNAPRAVLPSIQAHDAGHHGWYASRITEILGFSGR